MDGHQDIRAMGGGNSYDTQSVHGSTNGLPFAIVSPQYVA
jgi:hypothetical protein